MTAPNPFPAQAPYPMHGVRIWLSGAVPVDASPEDQEAIRIFVRRFAEQVFRGGAHIIHGSHPTVTPILLEEAKKHIEERGGRRDCLTLVVSKFWSKNPALVPVQEWRQTCMVYETPEATGASARDDSLQILREWMANRCDVFVAAGGQWWQQIAGHAGVPVEAGLAMMRGLPCFLLGGLGGAARGYIDSHPEIIRSLRNGFDEETNRRLAEESDTGGLVDTICRQLTRLPLVHGRVSDGLSFRILALDGGGIKGAFTASVLATLEQALGGSLANQFDLIAGTSTGGILAIALGLGLSPGEMVKFYRERGPAVFPIMRFYQGFEATLRHLFRPKHDQEALLRELRKAYFPDGKEKALGDSKCRLVIPAYDAISGVCHIFRTPHHTLLKGDEKTNAADVALATAAAPTYFSSAGVENMVARRLFIDGGVWANCPAMAAIVEAVCYLAVPLDRIDVLSIGTTDEPFTAKSMARAGILRWGASLISLFMNAQLDGAVRHAQQLVGESRFLRVNVMTAPGEYALDNSREIEALIALGNQKASQPEILNQVKSRFLNGVNAMDWREDMTKP